MPAVGHPSLVALAETCEVVAPDAFRWFGVEARLGGSARSAGPDGLRDILRTRLAEHLYTHAYLPGTPLPGGNRGTAEAWPVPALLTATGTSRQRGWVVTAVLPDAFLARRNGIEARIGPRQVVAPAEPGADLMVLVPRLQRGAAPGFEVLLGADDLQHEALARIYLNAPLRHRAAIAQSVSAALDSLVLPHRVKALTDDAGPARADTVVAYLPVAALAVAWAALHRVLRPIAGVLSPQIPLFSAPVAPGIAVAEDPGTADDSFGTHRCRLVADGLISAFSSGVRGAGGRLVHLARAFQDAGIDPAVPERREGTPALTPPPGMFRVPRPRPAPTPEAAAAAVAARLRRQAVRANGRATWLGTPLERPVDAWNGVVTLGGDLYSGTAGIGLALAGHVAATGCARSRRLAEEAFRHATDRADGLPPGDPHTGALGIAMAALHAGRRLGIAWMEDWAARTAVRCLRDDPPDGPPDLLGGTAGRCLGLLGLGVMLPERRLVERGAEVARTLRFPDADGGRNRRPSGAAHGAAGIALALAEAWALTGDPLLRTLAGPWVAHEVDAYDATLPGWPDLREPDGPARPADALAWCNGAPGVGLALARCATLSGDRFGAGETTRHALRITEERLRLMLSHPRPDLSLCHGMTGLAEVVRRSALRTTPAVVDSAAGRIAEIVLVTGAVTAGVPSGVAPGLMLGDAGVLAYLTSLSDPAQPSPLLPGPSWAVEHHAPQPTTECHQHALYIR